MCMQALGRRQDSRRYSRGSGAGQCAGLVSGAGRRMCRHTVTSVVASECEGEVVLIHQCDICGMTVPQKEVSEAVAAAAALDVKALTYAVRNAVIAAQRRFERLLLLEHTDFAAYKAEVSKLLGSGEAVNGHVASKGNGDTQ